MFFHVFLWVFKVFLWFFKVFHVFSRFFMVFHGFSGFFYGFSGCFMVFQGFSMVFQGVSWFFKVFLWFFRVFHGFSWFLGKQDQKQKIMSSNHFKPSKNERPPHLIWIFGIKNTINISHSKTSRILKPPKSSRCT